MSDVTQLIADYPKVKKILAEHMKVEVSDDWNVVDYDPEDELYQIHYGPNADMKKFGAQRGIIIHYNKQTGKCVTVCRGFEYTPTIKCDYIKSGSTVTLTDNLGKKHIVDTKKAIFKPGHEAATIRVFLFNGKVRRSHYRGLDIYKSKAKWGDSKTFAHMYDEAGAPKDSDLFDMTKKYSPIVHIILLVHPDISNVSKEAFVGGRGYALYVATKTMWVDEYPTDEVDGVIHEPKNLTHDINKVRNSEPGTYLYTPRDLNCDQVNYFLSYGWQLTVDSQTGKFRYHNTDLRQHNGEFVVAYLEGHKSTTIIKIQSTAYTWRFNLRGNDANLYHRFCELMEDCKLRLVSDEYLEKYPKFSYYTPESIMSTLDKKYIDTFPDHGMPTSVLTEDEKIYNIWISLILAVPFHCQKAVSKMLTKYTKDKKDVCEYLYNLYKGETTNDVHLERATQIVNLAVTHAIRNLEKNGTKVTVTDDKGLDDIEKRAVVVDILVKKNIEWLISNEHGHSLYKLIKLISTEDK